ncbi:protein pxr1-like [Pitangus sulphuratus]|nr:protein pxr1-like [Pitangus sulphuratus]
MPASSRMEQLLVKAKPIKDGDFNVIGEGGGGGAPGARADIPLQPVMKTMVMDVRPQPTEVNVRRSTCSLWSRPTMEQVDD